MLVEQIYKKYLEAQSKYEKYSQMEGFYGSELEDNTRTLLNTLAILFYFTLIIFLFVMIPLAIYYIILCGKKHNMNALVQVLLILLLFVPNMGFLISLFVIFYGVSACGMPFTKNL